MLRWGAIQEAHHGAEKNQTVSNSRRGVPRNPRIKFHFKREELDFFFQWITGAQTHGGTEVGECFYVASRVNERDPASWILEWSELGERVEARARTSLEKGHRISARESYLRCYAYYRAPLLFISPIHEREQYLAHYRRAQTCFRKAAALFEPPFEHVEIPFEDTVLPGYFLKPDDSSIKRKTLIMIGGGDTFVEDLYAYIGPAGLKRDYNVLLVDLPGQGVLPFEGHIWRSDYEAPMKTVVDWVLSRPDVDAGKLAAYGLSGGGYIVPRALTKEKRIKAAVACCIVLDMSEIWSQRVLDLYERAERSLLYRLIKTWFEWHRPAFVLMLDTYLWRFGAKSVLELSAVTQPHTLDPAEITCPMLNLVTEQEYNSETVRRFTQTAQECIDHALKQTIITPMNEGADSHGVGTNLSLMSQLVFDWLDDIFEAKHAGLASANEHQVVVSSDISG
jgi:pimeloyl-ACP methyl ester carboxylesterase